MANIFVSTFPFCRTNQQAIELLKHHGHNVVINSLGRKMKPEEVAEQAHEFDSLIAGTEDLNHLVSSSKKLRIISRVGVGLDSVPLELAKEKGVAVAYTPDAVSPAVSELAVSLIVDAMRKVTFADREIRAGKWTRPYGERIGNSVVGIIGFGRIGKRVASHLLGFMPKEILICDLLNCEQSISEMVSVSESIFKMNSKFGKTWNQTSIRQVALSDLMKLSDVITIHTPLTEITRKMINKSNLPTMKPHAVIINTARGGIIDEIDLFDHLMKFKNVSAALDVFEEEPYRGPLGKLDNIILTQHMGSCSNDCREAMEFEASENIVRFWNGEEFQKVI